MKAKSLTILCFAIALGTAVPVRASQPAAECQLKVRITPRKGKVQRHTVAIPLYSEAECEAYAAMHRTYYDHAVYKSKKVTMHWAGEHVAKKPSVHRKKASVSETPGYPISNQ